MIFNFSPQIIFCHVLAHDSLINICNNSEQQCDLILSRCNGIDRIPIVDDGGCLTKQVSVEDSFKRGTVTSVCRVKQKLTLLYGRLLRLLDQRREISPDPCRSFPKSIRLVIRVLDPKVENSGRSRPFCTKSKQMTFNGKKLLDEGDEVKRESILRTSALTLLETLLEGKSDVNVTKVNLALVSFADIKSDLGKAGQRAVTSYFRATDDSDCSATTCKRSSTSFTQASEKSQKKIKKSPDNPLRMPPPPGIDPSVFASLPVEIANEVMENQTFHQQYIGTKEKKAKGIERFFQKK